MYSLTVPKYPLKWGNFIQGSGSGLDPDLIGSVDPESVSGSRRAKMTHISRKKFVKVHVLSVGWPL